ncbi:hypothetical protein KFE25_012881 [Diacronema lutheri]|uniref:porphobilinogen synthase n=1 Tax=Diacronema lutheri TaxID=2081491 RepID=A0A8J5X8N4_DIALT|nr:hypothetical protein KFE25_012881 [Diacronema lutheri]
MPGCERHSLPSMVAEAKAAYAVGGQGVRPVPESGRRAEDERGEEAYNPAGIVPTAVRMLKAALPESVVFTDVALDPYSSEGHDGVVRGGEIVNDETIEQLCKQALCQARAGTDFVAPSDMMDGRVGAIRDALDSHGFQKKTYQQDPANGREALIELALDEAEGAGHGDGQAGMPYLDVIRRLKENTQLPVAAYHVSGEYAMLKAAAERGWLDERKAALEALLCFKRAGATT